MAKKRKVTKPAGVWIPFNKRGAALAYTLIAAMVLMILSTSLLTAAESNISVSTKNSEARRSYITCKSAVEYAKSIILQRANNAKSLNASRESANLANLPSIAIKASTVGNWIRGTATKDGIMHSFWVEPDTGESGFKVENVADADSTKVPDGKDRLAKCVVTLDRVIRTTTQVVTVCDTKKNSDGSFPVTAQAQTVTNVYLDPTKDMADDKSWSQIGLPAPTSGSTPKTASTMTNFGQKVEVLSVQDVYKYHIKIEASNQYSASNDAAQQRMQQLNYETDCTIGGSEEIKLKPSAVSLTPVPQNPGIEIFAVGGQYGSVNGSSTSLVNSGSDGGYMLADRAASDMAVVFKREIKATGNSGSISAPAVYFMNSDSLTSSLTVGNMADPTSNGHKAEITSNFVYFNGNINGTKNDQGSWLKLNKRDKNSVAIVQFNNTTITLRSAGNSLSTKVLNGLYYYNDNTDLFDFTTLDSKLKQVPETDYAAIRSVANEDYVNYLKLNIDNIVSGELASGNNAYSSDFAGWVGQGSLSNGAPSEQKGKTVYCYAGNADNWGNKLDKTDDLANKRSTCHPYAAKNIVFNWAGSGELVIPEDKTAIFQADYIAMSTNGKVIRTRYASSHFIVKSADGAATLTMVFPTDTVIMYADGSYTIKAGTYGMVPSGIDLFSLQAKSFFEDPQNHSYENASGNKTYAAFAGFSGIQNDAITPSFLLYGTKYGSATNPWVYDTVNAPQLSSDGKSAYPVLFNQPVWVPKNGNDQGGNNQGGNNQGWGNQNGHRKSLTAPQVYFMGAGDSIKENKQSKGEIHSDFIYYAGNNIQSTWKENSLKLYSYADENKEGIIYFAQNCTIYKRDSIFGDVYLYIPKGCYTFKPGTDLFNLNVYKKYFTYYTDDLSDMKQSDIDKAKKANYVDYIEQRHSALISGDTTDDGIAPENAGANWAPNGVLSNIAGSAYNEKDVYLYVNDTSKWDKTAVNYQASRINLQYVNSDALKVPAGKSVTFTANTISLNGQKTDISQADDTLVLQQGDEKSEFKLSTPSGTGYVNVILPHDLLVKCISGDSYKVPAGIYTVKSGTNLFGYTSVPDSPGKSSIQLDPFDITPVQANLFKKGKYTNE